MSREAWLVLAVLGGIVVVAALIAAVVLGVRVWRTRALLGQLGLGGKIAFYGALVYTIFPVDVLPDPIYLDDVGVLAGALIYLTRLVRQYRSGHHLPPGRPAGGFPPPGSPVTRMPGPPPAPHPRPMPNQRRNRQTPPQWPGPERPRSH